MVIGGDRTEVKILGQASAWLSSRLPDGWVVRPRAASLELVAPDGTASSITTEVRRSIAPRDANVHLGQLARAAQQPGAGVPGAPLLLVAPWIGPRTRAILEAESINYIDLTGNAWLSLAQPAVFIETQGSDRDPDPPARGKAGLRGRKAARLIRFLLDYEPPYGVRELAASAALAPGYVSRLLATLDREAVISRTGRGRVEGVDTIALIRVWSGSYDVYGTNEAVSHVAPMGPVPTRDRLKSGEVDAAVCVTGSFAAARLAPVTAPAMLTLYADDPQVVAKQLDLLPTDTGGNVVLLRPFDPVATELARREDGLLYAAPPQVAVDCLTGNGRMPAEGEAILNWMAANQGRWRQSSLPMPDVTDP